ncbi:MAG TPA: hypothetical protein DEA57_05560 [Sulfurihydrogenibium sp.]|uniref:hypothetical protein n=1 Tax=Sulfurihydrogenibium sp. (strain YO3AOP1) TaxID=436114 RepID=UPI0001725F45|nr:hypothetical protein [Sulfurihydrogenibium sp. YO3AOP1]ACD66440.1 conserved hypothetical protein [Sulfurihydrogenibium sp. YO3AOP1]HBT98922.1 hypothetical protein [Sulfurihydrogenibium sp.]
MAYTLPRSLYNILEEALGSKENELVTRDLFEERFKVINERFNSIDEKFKVVDEKFKRLELKLNILIILVLLALTLFNPAFLSIIEKLLKL